MPDFSRLTRHLPRQFVPADFNPADWPQIETLYDKLIETNLADAPTLEEFLRDWNELGRALHEEYARRYIAMTCQTDDQAAADAFKYFVTEISPKLKPRDNELEKHYLASPARQSLPPERYALYDKRIAERAKLFREANVPLETEEELTVQAYQTIRAAMTTEFEGQERTLEQLMPIIQEPDRARRAAAWRAIYARAQRDYDKLDTLFDKLFALRRQIARNADFDNYRDYSFAAYQRFDYTPEDCYQFHASVDESVTPLRRKIQARRRAQMKLDTLRPWDTQHDSWGLAPDPLGRPPLKPFQTARELIDGSARVFERIEPELAGQFRQMDALGVLDLENRKGKAPGGYQMSLPESGVPFIFMNAVGSDGDVNTLLHEGGHAFNAFATRDEWINAYRVPPTEFCEVASMGMELLGADYLNEFYSDADADRWRCKHLEGIVVTLGWVATIDAFQHWLYTHPEHTPAERADAWVSTYKRFAGDVDWSGLEHLLPTRWQLQLHIFEVPFYYIEYGIAQLGALQVWRNMRRDRRAAVAAYKRALAVGGSRPLPAIYEAADIKFDFSTETVKPLMAMVAKELGL